jgi:1,2-diacylglycerol 3-alpha-glucosyltransferase
MKVAVLFDNFGPYHLARITAVSSICEVFGVERSSSSQEYDWRRDSASRSFPSCALFTDQRSGCDSTTVRRRLANVLREFGPQAVAVPGWSSPFAFAALAWCVECRVPAVIMSESTSEDAPRIRWKEWIKRRYVGICDTGLVGGDRHRDYLVQLGMPGDRIFLGYDAVDNDYFALGADGARKRADLQRAELDLKASYFLASARFTDKKNLPCLLRAFARYRELCVVDDPQKSLDPWDLVLLGDGQGRRQLDELRHSLGLVEHVQMPGFIQYDLLPKYYGLASAFVHTSVVEQWGLVVNEAMASGLPIILSNRCGCASMLLQEGENGYLFDPCNGEALTDCMLRMTKLCAAERQGMGQRSREIVADFGPDRFAAGLSQAVRVALERPKSRRHVSDSLLFRAMSLKPLRHT